MRMFNLETAKLGTCADFPNTPHAQGTCENCDMWKPIAPLLGQDELPPIEGYTWAKGVSTEDNTIRSYRKTLKQREAQLTQALISLAAAQKESSKRFDRIEDLETKLDASEASLAEAQTRIGELELRLAKHGHGDYPETELGR